MCPRLSLIVLLTVTSTLPAADNWPEFRGPHGNGVSEAKDVPTKWAEGENVRWKTAIHDKGWSSPVVWGDRLFLTTAIPNDPAEADPGEQLTRGANQRVGHARPHHTGVDDARDRRSHGDRRQHGDAEHVTDLACAERTPRLVEQHDTRGPVHDRAADRSPQGEVAPAQDDDRRVRDLEQRLERGRGFGAGVDDGRHVGAAQRGTERGAGLGRDRRERSGPGRQQGEPATGSNGDAIERVGRRLGADAQPVAQASLGLGPEPQHGRLVARQVTEPGTAVAREHETARRREHGSPRPALG